MAHHTTPGESAKPKQTKKTFLRTMSYLRNDQRRLVMIGLLILVEIASSLLGSYLLRPIINDYILPGNLRGLVHMLVILGVVYLAGTAAIWVQYRLLNVVGQRTVTRIRADLFKKMERLPVKYFETHPHGDLMSRYTNDIDRISDALTDGLAEIIFSVLTLTGIFILMFYISPILTVVTLITIPVMYLCAALIVKKSRKYFKAQQSALGTINGYIEEMISGQRVIKIFGHEKKAESDFEVLNQDLNHKSLKAQFYSGLMMPLMQNLSTLNYVLIAIVGGVLAIFRGFDVGGLAVFLQYSRQFSRPINQLASLYNSIQAALAGAERIFQVIDEQPEPQDAAGAPSLAPVRGDVRMSQVVFGYKPEKTILKRNLFSRSSRLQSGTGRSHRSRKDHYYELASAVL